FLTRVTLIEILTYLDNERERAANQANEVLAELEELRRQNNLNANQSSLLVRCYLLRGNTELLDKRIQEAGRFYQKAVDVDPDNHYAILSIAQMSQDTKTDLWQKGLNSLEASGALKKRETS